MLYNLHDSALSDRGDIKCITPFRHLRNKVCLCVDQAGVMSDIITDKWILLIDLTCVRQHLNKHTFQ